LTATIVAWKKGFRGVGLAIPSSFKPFFCENQEPNFKDILTPFPPFPSWAEEKF